MKERNTNQKEATTKLLNKKHEEKVKKKRKKHDKSTENKHPFTNSIEKSNYVSVVFA